MVQYVATEQQIKWPDGQPIASWQEWMGVARTHHGHSNDEAIYATMFTNFGTCWERQALITIMRRMNMEYWPWVQGQSAPKGFVAKINSKVLNEKRKCIKWSIAESCPSQTMMAKKSTKSTSL